MAVKFNLGFTPTAEEVQNVSEVIVREVFVESPINRLHDIQTGIQHDKQIAYADGFDIVGEAISGCTPTELGDIAVTEKTWSPKLMGNRFTYCANDENKLFKILKKAKNTFPDFFDRQSSPDLELVAGILMNSIHGSIVPKVWFSDTAAALTSGAGVFTIGSNLGLFNQFDGLFKQIFADADIPVTAITKNGGANYAAQALAADEAKTILKGVRNSADIKLKTDPNKKFYVTMTIADNLEDSYVENATDNGGLTKDLQDGISTLKFRGIPVEIVHEWDQAIDTYQNDGTKWNLPHRVVLSTPENLPIGTLSTSDLENLEFVYDAVNKTNIIDFGWFMDAKMLLDYKVSAAY